MKLDVKTRCGFAAILVLIVCISISGRGLTSAKPQATTSPTPTPSKGISPKPTPPQMGLGQSQTLGNLQSKIRSRMLAPEAARGRVGIMITSLNTGKVVFENDAEKYFIPASNMKNFTVAAALEKLGPDFRFVTSVLAAAKPDAAGTIRGDLRIYGRGDISISTAFNNGDYYTGIDNLVDKIAAAGVKRIEGDLIGDESYFKGFAIPYTWEWDDLQWYDGAEISALPVNNNAVDLKVKPGTKNGSPCIVTVLPETALMPFVNTCSTSSSQPRTLRVFKHLGRNTLEISGTMPLGDKGFTGYIAYSHPSEMFMGLLKQRLLLKHIVLTGRSYLETTDARAVLTPIEIARLESPPFGVVAANTMKPSQNMFTEVILWTLGENERSKIKAALAFSMTDDFGGNQRAMSLAVKNDSSSLGLDAVKGFLLGIGISSEDVLQYDGSGMSRHDQVTPSAVVQLYTYMAKKSKNAQVWRDSLTVGAVDGTLSKRFAGTAAAGNIRGKTGTLDQVSALSGYVTTAGGEELVVSIIVNGVAETPARTSLIDNIVVQLAGFNGKID